jgi:hypothetical protein
MAFLLYRLPGILSGNGAGESALLYKNTGRAQTLRPGA